MKIEDRYIISAIAALTEVGEPIVDNNDIYSGVYKGYIASLGASIIQTGLLPSIILYENSPSAAEDKKKLIKAIQHILTAQCGYIFTGAFSRYIIQCPNQKKLLLDVEKALIAIKLALRIFKPNDNQEEE